MNITPHVNPLPVATAVNPPTDSLRRDNVQQPVITAPTHTNGSPAEKGLADRDRASANSSEQFNFTELQKSAEKNANQVSDNTGQSHSEQSNKEDTPEDAEHQHAQKSEQERAHEDEVSDIERQIEAKEAKIILELKQRDQEVRTHELAHAAVGGVHTGSPTYEYEMGPDGKKYAVAGEVSVDLSPIEGDPRATIAKMEKVHAAALAPAQPSAQDHKVAAQATDLIAQARSDLLALESSEEGDSTNPSNRASPYIGSHAAFHQSEDSVAQSEAFDQHMNQTLKSQEEIAPTMPNEIKERSQRIEGFYSTITQAYEKAPTHQFELTA